MLHKELSVEEVKKVMELRTSWHMKGWQKGLEEGRREILLKQLKRLGCLSPEVEEKIKFLSLKELDDLAEKIFEISSGSDLRRLISTEH